MNKDKYKFIKYLAKLQKLIVQFHNNLSDNINPASYPYYSDKNEDEDKDEDEDEENSNKDNTIIVTKINKLLRNHQSLKNTIAQLIDESISQNILFDILMGIIEPKNNGPMINIILENPKESFYILKNIAVPAVINETNNNESPLYEFNLDSVLVPYFNIDCHLLLNLSENKFVKKVLKSNHSDLS